MEDEEELDALADAIVEGNLDHELADSGILVPSAATHFDEIHLASEVDETVILNKAASSLNTNKPTIAQLPVEDIRNEVEELKAACLNKAQESEFKFQHYLLVAAFIAALITVVGSYGLLVATGKPAIELLVGSILFSSAGLIGLIGLLLRPDYNEHANLVNQGLIDYAKSNQIVLTPDNIEDVREQALWPY